MLRPTVAAIAVLSIAACHRLPVTKVARKPAVEIAPSAEVVARPGEQMIYRISSHNLEVAEMVISVGDPTTLEGKSVIAVHMRTTSVKLAGWFHPLDDTHTSWIDRATGRPVAYKAVALASRDRHDVEDSESRFAPGTFPVHVVRRGEAYDEQQTVRGSAYDLPSLITFVRGWDGEPGDQISVDMMRTRIALRTSVVVAGFENLPTALGDLPVVRYDGESMRIQRDGTEDPKARPRRFSIWITDDADRVPARLIASTDLGELAFELQSYRAQ